MIPQSPGESSSDTETDSTEKLKTLLELGAAGGAPKPPWTLSHRTGNKNI